MVRYPGLVEYDAVARAYGIVFPDLPGCCAMGDTLDELMRNAEDVLRDFVADLEREGCEVPEPSPFHSLVLVSLPERPAGTVPVDQVAQTGS